MDQESHQPGSDRVRFGAERIGMVWRERPTLLQRIGLVIVGLIVIGLLIIVGTAALIIGGAAVLVLAIVMLVQRGVARLHGRRTPGDTLRSNVRVIRRDSGT